VLCAVLAFSVYAGFVNVVSELFGHDFIETISLTSHVHSRDDRVFAVGDTIVVSAKVKRSNVYRLNVYDNSDRLVYEDAGAVNGSDVNVSVPVLPPAFNASRMYSLSFEADVVGYPLLGVEALDSSAASFAVVKSLTRLNMTTVYVETAHELRSVAVLTTDDGAPVQNGAVNFYMQPNVDFVKPDRGWIFLGSVQTDVDGAAVYSCGLSMMGGLHGLEARFSGDQDYGSSGAVSQFSVSYRPTQLRIVKAYRATGLFSVVLQLTDPSGFPLGGKVLSFEALGVTAQPLYAVTNSTGYAVMSFGGLVQNHVDSKITVLNDDYISGYQTFASLFQNGSEFSVGSTWGESGLGSLAVGEGSKRLAGAAGFQAGGMQVLDYSPIDSFIEANPPSGRADLPETITAGFCLATDPGGMDFTFRANNTLLATNLLKPPKYIGGLFSYNCTLTWLTDVSGNYNVTVTVSLQNNNTMV
jgi:hypothetical protein